MNNNPEFDIDHETRLRLVEQNRVDIKNALINTNNKIDSRFIFLIRLNLISIILLLCILLNWFRS
jgi:hypothetical protein